MCSTSFLAVAWFGSTPTPARPSVSSSGDTEKEGRLEGVREEPNHMTARRLGPLLIIPYFLPLPQCCQFLDRFLASWDIKINRAIWKITKPNQTFIKMFLSFAPPPSECEEKSKKFELCKNNNKLLWWKLSKSLHAEQQPSSFIAKILPNIF